MRPVPRCRSLPAVSVPKGSTRARAALAAAEASDFHRSVALSRAGTGAKGGGELRHWRWRGVLTEYAFIRPEPGTVSKGNLLLIHGFGAFGEHYRGASAALARMGYTVYAPTLPGYGRSEKVKRRVFFFTFTFFFLFFSHLSPPTSNNKLLLLSQLPATARASGARSSPSSPPVSSRAPLSPPGTLSEATSSQRQPLPPVPTFSRE